MVRARTSARPSTRSGDSIGRPCGTPISRPVLRATVAAADQTCPRARAGQVAEWQTRTVQVRVSGNGVGVQLPPCPLDSWAVRESRRIESRTGSTSELAPAAMRPESAAPLRARTGTRRHRQMPPKLRNATGRDPESTSGHADDPSGVLGSSGQAAGRRSTRPLGGDAGDAQRLGVVLRSIARFRGGSGLPATVPAIRAFPRPSARATRCVRSSRQVHRPGSPGLLPVHSSATVRSVNSGGPS